MFSSSSPCPCVCLPLPPSFFNPLWPEHQSFCGSFAKALGCLVTGEGRTHQQHPATWGQINGSGENISARGREACGSLGAPFSTVSWSPAQLGSCSWDARSCLVPSPAAPPSRAQRGLALGRRTGISCSPSCLLLLLPCCTHFWGGRCSCSLWQGSPLQGRDRPEPRAGGLGGMAELPGEVPEPSAMFHPASCMASAPASLCNGCPHTPNIAPPRHRQGRAAPVLAHAAWEGPMPLRSGSQQGPPSPHVQLQDGQWLWGCRFPALSHESAHN